MNLQPVAPEFFAAKLFVYMKTNPDGRMIQADMDGVLDIVNSAMTASKAVAYETIIALRSERDEAVAALNAIRAQAVVA